MGRWTKEETAAIAEMKHRLGSLLTDRPQFPEVVGERKMIRFLRGHDHNVDKATEMMQKFLIWRKENNVDAIRTAILSGLDHPLKFPCGAKILGLIPQIVISPYACDKVGSPICVDQYDFSPSAVLKEISIAQYIHFVIHTLEYRSLIVEQLSEQREREFLASLPDNSPEYLETLEQPYGVLVNTCVIRDLKGVGFEHIGSQGQEIIRAVIGVSSDNYPELMRKCFMINTPWLFNTLWYFIKGLLAARTIAKVSVMGTSYLEEIKKEISIESLPDMAGGNLKGSLEYFSFDWDLAYLDVDGSISSAKTVNNSVESVSLPQPPRHTDSSEVSSSLPPSLPPSS